VLKNDILKESLQNDFYESNGRHHALAYQSLLQWVSAQLSDQGKSMSQYGLPQPEISTTELQRHKLLHDVETERQEYETLCRQTPNTLEQQLIFNAVMEALQVNEGTIMFIDGKGGTGNANSTHITNIKTIISPGKTTLARKIMASTRMSNLIALGSASTALAATLYDDFETTHSLFKFPVVEDEDKEPNVPTECDLHRNPQREELLREEPADLFIFDEFPSLDREVFEAHTERWKSSATKQ